MDISLQKEDYRYLDKTFETSLEECVEAELSLPEYMPEILRIIKSSAIPKINSCRPVGERVTVDGVCELRMIYTAEDGCIYSFSQSRNFTRYCENQCFSVAEDVKVKAGVNYVNCRATSPKRAEIKAGVSLCVSAFSGVCEKITSLGERCSVEEKCVPVSAMSLGCCNSRNFSMSETVEIENGAAAFLISSSVSAIVSETKKIGNKIMIKGESIVEIAYVPCEDKSTVLHLTHTLPVNQILEFEGMNERFTGDVVLDVYACDVVIKNDSSGDGRAFDIALCINASVKMWEQKDFFVITDAYSVEGAVNLTKEKLVYFTSTDEIRDNYNFRENIDLSKIGVSAILDMTSESGEPVAEIKENTAEIKGSLKLSLLLRDTAGELVTLDKMVDYKYTKMLNAEYSGGVCICHVCVNSLDCSLNGSSQAEVRAQLGIVCTVFEKNETEVVSDISENPDVKRETLSAVTVYFPENEESLWNIARRYNTTVSAIADENDLEGETTGNRHVLFIPST